MLTTTGALEIRLADAPPTELAKDDIFVRLRGSAERAVKFADAAEKTSGSAPAAEFGATRGNITLTGDKPSTVELAREGDGTFTGQHFTLNIPTRVGQSRGPGRLAQAVKQPQPGEPEQRAQTLEWSDQADFEFAQGAKKTSWDAKRMSFAGTVIGADGVSGFNTEQLVAEFAPKSRIQHAVISGSSSTAHDGTHGVLRADSMRLDFKPGRNDKPEPSVLTAIGTIEARDKDQLLTSGLLEAMIGRNEAGKLAVLDAKAKENVVYSATGGPTATTNELHAKPQERQATLIGPDTSISQDASWVRGNLMRLDGNAKTFIVDGPGSFRTDGDEGETPLAAQGSWTGSMTFNDKTSLLEVNGNVSALSLSDPATLDRLRADTLKVQFDRTEVKADAPPEGTIVTGPKIKRTPTLITAAAVPGSGNAAPHIESKTYDGPVTLESIGDRRMIQTRSLDGATIAADVAKGALGVTGEGRALVFDRSEGGPIEPEETGDALASLRKFRGAALFEWRDAMSFTRATGVIDLAGMVKVTNDRPIDHSLIYFESDKATATMAGLNDPAVRDELVSADATGNVFARFKTAKSERELNAFRATYGGRESLLRLIAAEGGEVSLFDTATATPVKAKELVWDLAKDRVEIVKPSAITAPVVTPPR